MSAEYRQAARANSGRGSTVSIGDITVGGEQIILMVGPCAVESHSQMMAAAIAVREAGFPILRGGAYKPRTSPYAFRGLLEDGLRILDAARRETGLAIITEVMSETDVEAVAGVADILQIGARSMHVSRLLEAIADAGKPILLKRGFSATMKEWFLAAEYILKRGNDRVILCERGIRGFDGEYTRNVLDLAAVAVAKRETHLPVIVDPSHGTGRADLVLPMVRAAIAAGADGLLIEAHPDPTSAMCDGGQSLATADLPHLAREAETIARAVSRSVYPIGAKMRGAEPLPASVAFGSSGVRT